MCENDVLDSREKIFYQMFSFYRNAANTKIDNDRGMIGGVGLLSLPVCSKIIRYQILWKWVGVHAVIFWSI